MNNVNEARAATVIDHLLERAKDANNSDDALKYSQAALNAANAKARAADSN